MNRPTCSIFEYLYRDAANYKAFGKLLLRGLATSAELEAIHSNLEPDNLFIPEQVGLPPLDRQLWSECGAGWDPTLDHPWHEFVDLKPANAQETVNLKLFGEVTNLVKAFAKMKP